MYLKPLSLCVGGDLSTVYVTNVSAIPNQDQIYLDSTLVSPAVAAYINGGSMSMALPDGFSVGNLASDLVNEKYTLNGGVVAAMFLGRGLDLLSISAY